MLLALKTPLYTYCPAVFTIRTLVRERNQEDRKAGTGKVAKKALDMSLLSKCSKTGRVINHGVCFKTTSVAFLLLFFVVVFCCCFGRSRILSPWDASNQRK